MYLYVDETENNEYFIVTGLLVPSKECADIAHKRFKKKINLMNINVKMKQKLFNEFKSVLLDRQFQKIKIKMLEEIMKLDSQIIYSCHIKKEERFTQEMKERVYINLLNNIVSSIHEDIHIVFDSFNKSDFEYNIVHSIVSHKNVLSIEPKNSYDEAGIQFVDNLCSVIRLSYLDSKNNYYQIIKTKVVHV